MKKLFEDEKLISREVIDMGGMVVCDLCNADCTASSETGGFIFGSKGVCPTCAPSFLNGVKRYNEESYIKAFCPVDMSFADFIRGTRGENNNITIEIYES